MLVQCRADQDVAARGAGAIALRPIGGFADDRQLHPVIRADEPVQYLAAMHPDPYRAGRAEPRRRRFSLTSIIADCIASAARTAFSCRNGSGSGLPKTARIPISGDLVDSPIVFEDGLDQRRHVIVEQVHHIVGVHARGQ